MTFFFLFIFMSMYSLFNKTSFSVAAMKITLEKQGPALLRSCFDSPLLSKSNFGCLPLSWEDGILDGNKEASLKNKVGGKSRSRIKSFLGADQGKE